MKLVKAEKREKIKVKEKFAPKGGTLAGQFHKIEISKGYVKRKKATK